uniref:Plastocyanin-like domain-containing protein n=1 Tax=Ananas comosus var. bracteatus TaxID=296719 RepID=A0A6V7NKN3_ANACO|nr:unnamed protein product [Ananas comosus var. bracteatus]
MGKRTISRLSISISPRPLHHHHHHHHHHHEDHQHHLLLFLVSLALLASSNTCNCDDPYRFFTWNVTYADIWPLGVKQQAYIPHRDIDKRAIPRPPDRGSDERQRHHQRLQLSLRPLPHLLERDTAAAELVRGRRVRDDVPDPPGRNFTYVLQMKDQIGTYYYFPSLAFHKAAGGFGGIRVLSRPLIPVPFPRPPPTTLSSSAIGSRPTTPI